MPTYGTCQMCKETAYLTAKVLRNKETGSLHLFMLCDCCRKFYEKTCATCKYRSDDFTSACVNGESEHCADFVSEDDWCEEWEGKEDLFAEEKVDEILSKQNPCLYCEVLLAEKEKLICPYCEKRKEYESTHDD